MYFVYRDGKYIDVAGKSFRDFLARKIPELSGITPMMSDWADHLTTLFPEVRMKRYLEVRGADGGTWRRICGLPALWAGLLYDQTALDAAWDLVKDWTSEEREAMRASVPVLAFNTPFRDTNVLALSRRMLKIATAGLESRAKALGIKSEKGYIEPFQELVDRGQTRAEELVALFKGEWKGDLCRLFDSYNFL
jgi:glutamate--cysteine ligase